MKTVLLDNINVGGSDGSLNRIDPGFPGVDLLQNVRKGVKNV
jgi:hypothetical protein